MSVNARTNALKNVWWIERDKLAGENYGESNYQKQRAMQTKAEMVLLITLDNTIINGKF